MTKSILIVDDDQNQRESLEGHLRKAGYNVRLAASRAEALRLFSAEDSVTASQGDISRPCRKLSSGQLGFKDLIGVSESMKKTIRLAKRGAGSNIPILLEGESGVGKELFARAIQGESDRRDKAFVVINCGAIPQNLVESILFGHEKGAFTGAVERHIGKFVAADGGTLFLDEIGELPREMQVKLLRVLQEGEVTAVGGGVPVRVDVRLISATNQCLQDLVTQGRFREDLFYRLNVFPIRVPALWQRKDDIEYLVRYIIKDISLSEACSAKEISSAAMELLKNHSWPGNVRQLENALFRALVLSESEVIKTTDFPQIYPNISRHHKAMTSGNRLSVVDDDGDIRPVCEVEKAMIRFALRRYNGRMSEVARRLGMGRSTLYRKVADFGLEREIR